MWLITKPNILLFDFGIEHIERVCVVECFRHFINMNMFFLEIFCVEYLFKRNHIDEEKKNNGKWIQEHKP